MKISCRFLLLLFGQLLPVGMRGIHTCALAVILSEKRRSGLACRGKRILLPNWVGVFEGGGWPKINEKFEFDDNDEDGGGEKEDEDVSMNVIDDVQKTKNKKKGAENRINFWRQVS